MNKRLLVCGVTLLSLGQGQAFAPMPTFGRASSVNHEASLSHKQVSPVISQRTDPRSSLEMVGGVFEPLDTPVPLRSPESSLSPLEVWCLIRIEKWYSMALNRRCPFLRRRMTDMIDALEMMIRISVIRREKIDLVGPEVSLRGDERTKHKIKHLNLNDVAAIIRRDWREESHKGYYITGRLTPAIYRNDCFFEGPDPDMPVKGLRKFLNAASQLFDPKQSVCELLKLEVQGDVIVADWKMNGVLKLPWRPKLPEVYGQTTYHFDEDGLIIRHAETWDLSAVDAFLRTAWFDFQFQTSHSHNDELQEMEGY